MNKLLKPGYWLIISIKEMPITAAPSEIYGEPPLLLCTIDKWVILGSMHMSQVYYLSALAHFRQHTTPYYSVGSWSCNLRHNLMWHKENFNNNNNWFYLAGYSTKHLRRVVEACPQHIDTVMSYYRHSLYDDSLLKDLPFFKSRNIGVINASPLGMHVVISADARPILKVWGQQIIRIICHDYISKRFFQLVTCRVLAAIQKHGYGCANMLFECTIHGTYIIVQPNRPMCYA